MATFTWTPDFKASSERSPRARVARFGDGYEQRQADGLNADRQVWSLSFAQRDYSEIDAIEAFLVARGAVEKFDWTPPRSGSAIKVVCRRWSRTVENGPFDSLMATFEQVFEA